MDTKVLTAKLDRRRFMMGIGAVGVGLAAGDPAFGQSFETNSPRGFSGRELLDNGHRFFGGVTRGFASLIERATQQWGRPNGYVLGQEGGGAFIAGLRYGEGTLFTKTDPDTKVFWQGPSLGLDFGGEGARAMMLVYRLRGPESLYRRFGGIDGSAYVVGGFGMTALSNDEMLIVPIRTGVGLRLGLAGGYLKFTPSATWNPF